MRLFGGGGRQLKKLLRAYSFDGDPHNDIYVCGNCTVQHPRSQAVVLRDQNPYALYSATAGEPGEVYYDVTLLRRAPDQLELTADVVFSVRFGDVISAAHPAFSLAGITVVGEDDDVVELTRENGLEHPRIAELWSVMDWLYFTDPMLHQVHFHGHTVTAENWLSLVTNDAH